jgi:hypothetical protein
MPGPRAAKLQEENSYKKKRTPHVLTEFGGSTFWVLRNLKGSERFLTRSPENPAHSVRKRRKFSGRGTHECSTRPLVLDPTSIRQGGYQWFSTRPTETAHVYGAMTRGEPK